MNRTGRWALAAAAVAGGAAVGYLAERAVLRPRLSEYEPPGVPLGSIAGETREIHGPDGTRITVEAYGPSGAPQVLLSHGLVCTGRVWHEQVAALADRYRLITYDQPGHGRSSAPRSGIYDVDLFGDTMRTVLEQAAAPGPVVLVGHSLGGMSIMNLLRRFPELAGDRVRGVALLSTTSHTKAEDVRLGLGVTSLARLEKGIRRVLEGREPEAAYLADRVYRASTDLSFLLTRTVGLAPGAPARYVDFTEQLLLDSDFEMITGVLGPVLSLDEDEALACLIVPTVLVCGAADRITPIDLTRRMAERCPHATLLELPGVGHMTPLEAHEDVNRVISGLVARTIEQAA